MLREIKTETVASVTIIAGKQRVSTTPAEIARKRFLGRGIITNAFGDMRIDGVDITHSEEPVIMQDIEKTVKNILSDSINLWDRIGEFTRVEVWRPTGFPKAKNIELIRDRNRRAKLLLPR